VNIIFGPIHSRRFGKSLGVDLSPGKKQCNFDCLYCELDPAKTMDAYDDVVSVVEVTSALKTALKEHDDVDFITLTANGEPTLYPHLSKLIDEINTFKGKTKTLILSNAANIDEVGQFLIDSCEDADGLVISIDTLLYGGLIPSRLHHIMEDTLKNRMELVKKLKENNSKLKIYAFQCIMRCPKYSSNDEEPDYYEECGAEIHKIGELEHKVKLGIGDEAKLNELYSIVKEEYITDYRSRRKRNLSMNLLTLDYVKEGIIDFLIIPQDDSAKYGFTAMDQEIVREKIYAELLQDVVLMYPGADEIAMTLLSRVTNEMNGRKPKVYIRYASIHAPFIIPAYEDRTLGETIKYHIHAAGCSRVDSVGEADLILAISAPAGEMLEANIQPVRNSNYGVERNMTEFISFIEEQINSGKPVAIGDNAYANGGDLELIDLLNKKG